MNATFEGDLIRPLGLVTLYFAYAEGEIDELIEAASVVEPYDDEKRQWSVGRKLGLARKLLGELHLQDWSPLGDLLDEGRTLFESRNALVHGQLFAGGRLVSNRRAVRERRITPNEITQLAEQIFVWKERLWAYRQKVLAPQLPSIGRGSGA
ncbi:MAG: hypothetical protein IPM20_10520 [Gammaproteobacteria bacterium]|nr:hypothetical protein [Gammaproteobacteria bacterium]